MTKLYDLINNGFGIEEDFNCAEKILYGANKVYNLGLSKDALKLSSGFGGGMGIESVCGALTAGVMIMGHIFVKERGHESELIKEKNAYFLNRFKEDMGNIDCTPLKDDYRTEELGCKNVILKSAEVVDYMLKDYLSEV